MCILALHVHTCLNYLTTHKPDSTLLTTVDYSRLVRPGGALAINAGCLSHHQSVIQDLLLRTSGCRGVDASSGVVSAGAGDRAGGGGVVCVLEELLLRGVEQGCVGSEAESEDREGGEGRSVVVACVPWKDFIR